MHAVYKSYPISLKSRIWNLALIKKIILIKVKINLNKVYKQT